MTAGSSEDAHRFPTVSLTALPVTLSRDIANATRLVPSRTSVRHGLSGVSSGVQQTDSSRDR